MRKSAVTLLLCVGALARTMFAAEGSVPKGIPHLDHVFVILMENHAYGQIVGNPSAPFANSYIRSANSATNYFAVGHPSSTNYLEIVGGSYFGVRSDNAPDWHNAACTPNLLTTPLTTNFDTPNSGPVCPIYGTGTDAATPAIDNSGMSICRHYGCRAVTFGEVRRLISSKKFVTTFSSVAAFVWSTPSTTRK